MRQTLALEQMQADAPAAAQRCTAPLPPHLHHRGVAPTIPAMSESSDSAGGPATAPASNRVFPRLLRMLRPHRGTVAVALVLLLLSMPGELFPGMIWMYVADHLIRREPTGWTQAIHGLVSFGGRLASWQALLVSALAWLMGVYVLAEAFGTISSNLMQRVAQRFILSLRNRVYHKLQSQSLGYLQRQRTGDLMSRAMGDVDELQQFIVGSIDVIVGEGVMWLVTVALVMSLDWRVASASLAPLIVVYLLLRVFNRKVQPIYKAARERAGDVSTRLQENLNGVVVIKIFGREKQEAGRFRQATEAYYDQQVRAINARSLFFPFSRAVGFLSNVFMIGVGGWSIRAGGSVTLGKLLAFRAYWWRLFGPIQTLARVNDMVQRASAAGRRVFEVLDAPDELPDAPGAVALDRVRGEMELREVTFAYGCGTGATPVQPAAPAAPRGVHGRGARATEAAHVVLREASIRIEPGQTVALCGPCGSGKSTILNLLLRFYDPTGGVVTLDGRDLRAIARDSLRRHFALVQQETFLFDDSILDNIRYGLPDATMEQVIAAARAANAHEFIAKLPSGYETKVGERGVRLSGGQKQRISIARAFLANPAILLLDEPTSSVEPDSEAAIIAALDRLMRNRTTVLTSHRPSLIMQADHAYVIEDGRVTEQGPPAELARNGGWFGRFMRSAEQVETADERR
ncbi:MAG TPA: ABC transporter ATP-binding protein [Tepidisphaeraceae bacterium]|nr:ABC transporter ATP-binding protein [Tepidisphaeraceae bacterium]